VPGPPFAYWVSDNVRALFKELPPFESNGRIAKQGLATANDLRAMLVQKSKTESTRIRVERMLTLRYWQRPKRNTSSGRG